MTLDTGLALLPLVWLLVSLGILRMEAWAATLVGFAGTALLALLRFSMPARDVAGASLEGAMLALFPILWVIFSALFLYNVTQATGALRVIIDALAGLSLDRRAQVLVIAFCFGGFLEAVAGFGTAVAIPAGILVSMGFEAVLAAVVCLAANTVPVAFGVLGIPMLTLAQVTSLPLDRLSLFAALQLAPFTIALPFVLIYIVTRKIHGREAVGARGTVGARGAVGIALVSGIAFASGQTVAATLVGAELPAVVGSLLSLAATIAWIRLRAPRSVAASGHAAQIKAWSPYVFVLLLVAATRLLPALSFLGESPFTVKRQFYFGQGGKPLVFQLATGGGTILFLSALLGGLAQKAGLEAFGSALVRTLRQMAKTAVTVMCILALAKIMTYGGMVDALAESIAAATGGLFPLVSPAIGALGTFLTGSDTSSNVLFGGLQARTAINLGLDPSWIAAANTAGATAGKMISPQSIAIAAAAAGLVGREGELLAGTAKYCLGYVAIMGLLVFAFAWAI